MWPTMSLKKIFFDDKNNREECQTWIVNLLAVRLVNNQRDELSVLRKVLLHRKKINKSIKSWEKKKIHISWSILILMRETKPLFHSIRPCRWYVWKAAPTRQRPLLDTAPPVCTAGCLLNCRRPWRVPAFHPNCCMSPGKHETHVELIWCEKEDLASELTHKPVDAGGFFEQRRVPAEVNDIIILTQVLPSDPKHTWRDKKK